MSNLLRRILGKNCSCIPPKNNKNNNDDLHQHLQRNDGMTTSVSSPMHGNNNNGKELNGTNSKQSGLSGKNSNDSQIGSTPDSRKKSTPDSDQKKSIFARIPKGLEKLPESNIEEISRRRGSSMSSIGSEFVQASGRLRSMIKRKRSFMSVSIFGGSNSHSPNNDGIKSDPRTSSNDKKQNDSKGSDQVDNNHTNSNNDNVIIKNVVLDPLPKNTVELLDSISSKYRVQIHDFDISSITSDPKYEKEIAFSGQAIPNISLLSYLERILRYCNKAVYEEENDVTSSGCLSLVAACIYLTKFLKLYPEFRLTGYNIHRLFLAAIVIAQKFLQDEHPDNSYTARVGGVKIWEISQLESTFAESIKFEFFITFEELQETYRSLLNPEYNLKISDMDKPYWNSVTIPMMESLTST